MAPQSFFARQIGGVNAILTVMKVEFERETDGRWIAEVKELPGVMAYGKTKQEAQRKVYAIALRTLADKVERGTPSAPVSRLFKNAMARR
mgnify:CR=1 FL=1